MQSYAAIQRNHIRVWPDAFKCSEIIADNDAKIVSGLHTIACRPKMDFASKYLGYCLNSCAYHNQLLPHIQGTKISSISKKAIAQTSVSYPSTDEQQALGLYFQHLDSLIQSTTKKIESLKQVKAASLQSMFPQEGETTPRVRFKGFSKEWDSKLTSDICKIGTGESNTHDHVDDGQYPFFIRSEKVMRSDRYLYDCEAVITIGDGQIGKVFHYVNGKFDLHQRCYKMCDFNDVDAKYFFYFFSTFFYDRAIKMSAKATVDSIRMDMIAGMQILYPSLDEQKQIASYFTSLDTQISLQTQRLEKLKQIKSACLDNMFV